MKMRRCEFCESNDAEKREMHGGLEICEDHMISREDLKTSLQIFLLELACDYQCLQLKNQGGGV